MDPEPRTYLLHIILQFLNQEIFENSALLLLLFIVILLMLFISTITSAAENAFFSLTPGNIDELSLSNTKSANCAIKLLNEPNEETAGKKLLASILLINNFTNIFVVISSSLLISLLFNFSQYPVAGFIIEIVAITFVIVLISEIIPKIYATQNALRVALLMAIPLYYSQILLKPFIWILVYSTNFIDKYFEKKQQDVSLEELNHAIEITSDKELSEEKNILKSLVNFGNTSVKQIMKPRLDVIAVEKNTSFNELLKLINECGYSRIPVYENDFDSILGILYIKDILPLVSKSANNTSWESLIRPPFIVPEFKKIDDLLNEFKTKKIHMAIVADEYGGTLGIVTLEDILEEIFGEIKDEFDDDEAEYKKINENTYLFEGKTQIVDLLKISDTEPGYFDEIKGEAETIAGLIMELTQNIPSQGDKAIFGKFAFSVDKADNRKVIKVRVEINQ
ncbi:MAG: gliding motility-associated protein GldE [Bacteroidia bacterium]|nr:gliding motility-associated protein GldE [Bacteroidia bacterium]